ncbi:calcium/proton exchanger [Aestuariivirga litoralis]|uniref:Ca(2+)/H(+) antiporter n=1 Tax=Aestuariivirga litoralis TaxID=2650924 RepID=A0A2W2AXH7_9HYPH|nr:calcium/proton exchanger [Aestuariivirga litoralis]PZF77320.1 calcium/proton exchanger [Aestuariivirga litoralis]
MGKLLGAIRDNKVLWLLPVVPAPLIAEAAAPGAHTLTFLLAILAIVPLAALLSLATEQVAARTGDTIGGLLNATLGNLTELLIALAALQAGEYLLVKATIAGAIVTNALFMTGMSFLLGGLRHHVQEFNRGAARLQVALLFLAAFGLMVPSALADMDSQSLPSSLSVAIAVILLAGYGFSLVFTLGTHREYFAAAAHEAEEGAVWPLGLAIGVLLGTTVVVALVSEVFVASLTGASAALGLSPAFVGFVVVAIVGAAAEMTAAFAAARRNRLDLSLGISFGSAVQIALFVAPVLVLLSHVIGPQPMSLQFWPGAVVMIFVATLTAALTAASGHAAWFIGLLMLMIYAIFGVTLFILPPT